VTQYSEIIVELNKKNSELTRRLVEKA